MRVCRQRCAGAGGGAAGGLGLAVEVSSAKRSILGMPSALCLAALSCLKPIIVDPTRTGGGACGRVRLGEVEATGGKGPTALRGVRVSWRVEALRHPRKLCLHRW